MANKQPSAHAFSTCISLMDARHRALQESKQHIIGSVKIEFHIVLKWRRYQFGDQIHAPAILTPEEDPSLDRCIRLISPKADLGVHEAARRTRQAMNVQTLALRRVHVTAAVERQYHIF
jgi:hypothetical protein